MKLGSVLVALFASTSEALLSPHGSKETGFIATHADSGGAGSESSTLNLRETSVAEVMETMTIKEARAIFERMNQTANKAAVSEVMEQAPMDKAILNRARVMINEMMEEAQIKKETETVRCDEFERKQLTLLSEVEADIAFVNSEAAEARSDILRAQEIIGISVETKMPTTRWQLWQHEEQCSSDRNGLKQQLAVLMADIAAMRAILGAVCVVKSVAQGSSAALLDVGMNLSAHFSSAINAEDGSIVKCNTCDGQGQVAWMRHTAITPMLASLKSPAAKKIVEQNLAEEFDATGSEQMEAALVQADPAISARQKITPPVPDSGPCNEELLGKAGSKYRGCQAKSRSGNECQKWSAQFPNEHAFTPAKYPTAGLGDHNYCRNPDGKETVWCYTTNAKNQGEKPWEYCDPKKQLKQNTGTTESPCVVIKSCKFAKPQCDRLRDRFLVILADMMDQKSVLLSELYTLNTECKKVTDSFTSSIATLNSEVKEQQTMMASATMRLQENQHQAMLSAEQHKDLTGEYTSTMNECCNNKNGFTNEICSLAKIRGEVYKQAKVEQVIKDCEVSAWIDGECSKSCAGGKTTRNRSPIVMTDGGTKCPPLSMTASCNLQSCPVDCKVDEWSEWSECSAECGGGVQQRTRDRMVPADNGGEPCPDESESRGCNVQSCNADCVLSDWSEWGLCSKACDIGHEVRTRKVAEEERGTGSCPSPTAHNRMDFQVCNTWSCELLLPPNRSSLRCNAMMDLIVLVDGSGSLGKYGWEVSKNASIDLVAAMEGKFENTPNLVQVGVLLFSGPNNDYDYQACTSTSATSKKLDIDKQCGMQWVSRLTQKVPSASAKVKAMQFPAKTTLTSMALAEARTELINGRPEANSVVVVITDGKPMSLLKTGQMSEELKKQSRLVWVPVGHGVDDVVEDMQKWASQPWEDNVIRIDNFASMALPKTVDNIVASICNRVS